MLKLASDRFLELFAQTEPPEEDMFEEDAKLEPEGEDALRQEAEAAGLRLGDGPKYANEAQISIDLSRNEGNKWGQIALAIVAAQSKDVIGGGDAAILRQITEEVDPLMGQLFDQLPGIIGPRSRNENINDDDRKTLVLDVYNELLKDYNPVPSRAEARTIEVATRLPVGARGPEGTRRIADPRGLISLIVNHQVATLLKAKKRAPVSLETPIGAGDEAGEMTLLDTISSFDDQTAVEAKRTSDLFATLNATHSLIEEQGFQAICDAIREYYNRIRINQPREDTGEIEYRPKGREGGSNAVLGLIDIPEHLAGKVYIDPEIEQMMAEETDLNTIHLVAHLRSLIYFDHYREKFLSERLHKYSLRVGKYFYGDGKEFTVPTVMYYYSFFYMLDALISGRPIPMEPPKTPTGRPVSEKGRIVSVVGGEYKFNLPISPVRLEALIQRRIRSESGYELQAAGWGDIAKGAAAAVNTSIVRTHIDYQKTIVKKNMFRTEEVSDTEINPEQREEIEQKALEQAKPEIIIAFGKQDMEGNIVEGQELIVPVSHIIPSDALAGEGYTPWRWLVVKMTVPDFISYTSFGKTIDEAVQYNDTHPDHPLLRDFIVENNLGQYDRLYDPKGRLVLQFHGDVGGQVSKDGEVLSVSGNTAIVHTFWQPKLSTAKRRSATNSVSAVRDGKQIANIYFNKQVGESQYEVSWIPIGSEILQPGDTVLSPSSMASQGKSQLQPEEPQQELPSAAPVVQPEPEESNPFEEEDDFLEASAKFKTIKFANKFRMVKI